MYDSFYTLLDSARACSFRTLASVSTNEIVIRASVSIFGLLYKFCDLTCVQSASLMGFALLVISSCVLMMMFTYGWCSRMFTHPFSRPSSYQFRRLHLHTVALSRVIFSHLSAPTLVQNAISLIVLMIPIKFLCHKFCSFPPIFHTLVRWTFKSKKYIYSF